MFKKFYVSMLTILSIIAVPVNMFAAEKSASVTNSETFGIWTILPPLIAIVLAFITKEVVISLFLGALSGIIMLSLNGGNILQIAINTYQKLVDTILGSLADPWNAGIILQCLTIGGVIALVSKMGGAKAVAQKLASRAKTQRSAQITSWVLGLLVFFDDYANSLIVGPIMRPVSDEQNISREKLAFIVDATAAPVAGIAIISTWIGLELTLIRDGFIEIGYKADAYSTFVETIPYRFYNIFILAFIVLTAIMLKEFGPMKKAALRANTGEVLRKGSTPLVSSEISELEPQEGIKLSIWNAIIPIGVLVFGAFLGFYYNGYQAILAGEDTNLIASITNSPLTFFNIQKAFENADASIVLFQSALLATIVALIMGTAKKIFTIKEGIGIWISGVKSLVITAVILILAWTLSSTIKELGTAQYLANMLSGAIPYFLLPSLIFILGAIISFATGTSYGTMGILMPLAIPLAYAVKADPQFLLVNIAAVLTGATFGDHCSPISDTTILSSMGTSCDHIDHVKTQLPYALFMGGVAIIVGYIPAAMGASPYILLVVGIAISAILLRQFGTSVKLDKSNQNK